MEDQPIKEQPAAHDKLPDSAEKKAINEDVNLDQDILSDIFHTEVNPHATKRSHKEAGDDEIDPLTHRRKDEHSDDNTPPQRFVGL